MNETFFLSVPQTLIAVWVNKSTENEFIFMEFMRNNDHFMLSSNWQNKTMLVLIINVDPHRKHQNQFDVVIARHYNVQFNYILMQQFH